MTENENNALLIDFIIPLSGHENFTFSLIGHWLIIAWALIIHPVCVTAQEYF